MAEKKKEIESQLEQKHADTHRQIQELEVKLNQERRLREELSK